MANEATKPQVANFPSKMEWSMLVAEAQKLERQLAESKAKEGRSQERIAQQSAELATLRAENARLKAPVSDEEIKQASSNDWQTKRLSEGGFNRIIQSRLSAPQKEEPHELA